MKRRASIAVLGLALLGLALVFAGSKQAGAGQPQAGAGYTCPITGEDIACPSCCPL